MREIKQPSAAEENWKRATDSDDEILRKVNSNGARSLVQSDYDTLESLIGWLNNSQKENNPTHNEIAN